VIALVVLGSVLRFGDITRAAVRNDEGQTCWAIAGSNPEEIREELYSGEIYTPAEVLEYQFPRPGTSWLDTVRGLARSDPKQSPLYYVTARWWVQTFGSSVAVLRSFGTLLGLLCLPLVYLLARELFEDPLVAWVAVGVVAVSPIRVVYDRDARPYAMWAIFIVLCSWLLLVAVRRSRDEARLGIRNQASGGVVAQSRRVGNPGCSRGGELGRQPDAGRQIHEHPVG
jgi:uncharacterized membrane protein